MFGLFKKKKSQSTTPKAQPVEPETLPAELEFSAAQLVPRLKNKNFLAALKEMGIPEDQLPVTHNYVAGLDVTYAFDMPSSFMMASKAEIAKLGLSEKDVLEIATKNLIQNLPEMNVRQEGSFHILSTGNALEATLLLVDGVWKSFSSRLEGKLIACAPHRDVILFCDSSDSTGMELLTQFSNRAHNQGDNHGLTLDRLEWTSAGWIPFEEA